MITLLATILYTVHIMHGDDDVVKTRKSKESAVGGRGLALQQAKHLVMLKQRSHQHHSLPYRYSCKLPLVLVFINITIPTITNINITSPTCRLRETFVAIQLVPLKMSIQILSSAVLVASRPTTVAKNVKSTIGRITKRNARRV